jgi:hypothetical protein
MENKMMNGTYYLNQKGTRWVVFNRGEKEKCLIRTDRGYETRTILFYEQFGNFATACISYKGKKIHKFPDDRFDVKEMNKYFSYDAYPKEWDGLMVIDLREKK